MRETDAKGEKETESEKRRYRGRVDRLKRSWLDWGRLGSLRQCMLRVVLSMCVCLRAVSAEGGAV